MFNSHSILSVRIPCSVHTRPRALARARRTADALIPARTLITRLTNGPNYHLAPRALTSPQEKLPNHLLASIHTRAEVLLSSLIPWAAARAAPGEILSRALIALLSARLVSSVRPARRWARKHFFLMRSPG